MYLLDFRFRLFANPDSKVHGANMGPTWVLSAPDGTHVGPMNFAIREDYENAIYYRKQHILWHPTFEGGHKTHGIVDYAIFANNIQSWSRVYLLMDSNDTIIAITVGHNSFLH